LPCDLPLGPTGGAPQHCSDNSIGPNSPPSFQTETNHLICDIACNIITWWRPLTFLILTW
jgi:hypothetical protein